MKSVSIATLHKMKQDGEKIAVLTCYDATFSEVLDDAGVDVMLIGDSLGMVVQGQASTVSVTIEDMIYHSKLVSRGAKRALVVTDLPFMSYATPEQAMHNAARLMNEGNAQMVKLEGGEWLTETIQMMSDRGIPVCAHLGLLPQSVNQLGGYFVQGRDEKSAQQMISDAQALEAAGALMLVLELVPRKLAAEISKAVSIPVIGIGAGVDTDGQVLVLHDMLGISGRCGKLCKNFMQDAGNVQGAIADYVNAVKAKSFPAEENGFD